MERFYQITPFIYFLAISSLEIKFKSNPTLVAIIILSKGSRWRNGKDLSIFKVPISIGRIVILVSLHDSISSSNEYSNWSLPSDCFIVISHKLAMLR